MAGSYRMVDETRAAFDVVIPAFSLDSPEQDRSAELRRSQPVALTGRGEATKVDRATVNGNAVHGREAQSAAAPATVSGKFRAESHCVVDPGKAARERSIREPGDLPSKSMRAGRGASVAGRLCDQLVAQAVHPFRARVRPPAPAERDQRRRRAVG